MKPQIQEINKAREALKNLERYFETEEKTNYQEIVEYLLYKMSIMEHTIDNTIRCGGKGKAFQTRLTFLKNDLRRDIDDCDHAILHGYHPAGNGVTDELKKQISSREFNKGG